MSTPDTPVVDYAWWRNLCDVAEADGNGPYVVVQTHTLRALLDAHEREAGRRPTHRLVEYSERPGGWRTSAVYPASIPNTDIARVPGLSYRITPLGPCGPTTTYEPEEGE